MIADEAGYILALHVNAYRARDASFRWVECSVATGLLKKPRFLKQKKPKKDKETKFKPPNTSNAA